MTDRLVEVIFKPGLALEDMNKDGAAMLNSVEIVDVAPMDSILEETPSL